MVKKQTNKSECCSGMSCGSGSSGCYYFLGVIGAAIYFIAQAATFWGGVVAFLKALVWPVFLVYGLLSFLSL